MEVRTPRVDLSAWQDPTRYPHELEVARLAFQVWGFAEFVNHDITDEILDEVFEASQAFYALEEEEKLECMGHAEGLGQAANFQPGYRGDIRAPDGRRRAKEHFVCSHYVKKDEILEDIFKPVNIWPKNPANFKSSVKALYQEFTRLSSTTLMDIFSDCLGIEGSFLSERMSPPDKLCRRFFFLHHCHQATDINNTKYQLPGVPAHEDPSGFTIVVQANKGVDGLQVLRDDVWTTIRPAKYSLLVFPGDCLKVWSNGSMESITHRVINSPTASRFSLAYFVYPPLDMIIEPIEKLLSPENPPCYKPFKLFELTNLDPEIRRLKHFKLSRPESDKQKD